MQIKIKKINEIIPYEGNPHRQWRTSDSTERVGTRVAVWKLTLSARQGLTAYALAVSLSAVPTSAGIKNGKSR